MNKILFIAAVIFGAFSFKAHAGDVSYIKNPDGSGEKHEVLTKEEFLEKIDELKNAVEVQDQILKADDQIKLEHLAVRELKQRELDAALAAQNN